MSGTTKYKATGDGGEGDVAPAQLLRDMHALRDRTSVAGRGYWLPLLLFGALICGSLPFFERLQQPRPRPLRVRARPAPARP